MKKRGVRVFVLMFVCLFSLTVWSSKSVFVQASEQDLFSQIDTLNNTVKGFTNKISDETKQFKTNAEGSFGFSDFKEIFQQKDLVREEKEQSTSIIGNTVQGISSSIQYVWQYSTNILSSFHLEDSEIYTQVGSIIGTSKLHEITSIIKEGGKSILGLTVFFTFFNGYKTYMLRKNRY